jgi:hypothetical protein
MASDLFDFELRAIVEELRERVKVLEEKVSRLENGGRTSSPNPKPATAPVSVSFEGLVEAIRAALEVLGEGDSAIIRQKVAERGMSAATKSDVNKAPYANQTLFKIDRTEGAKPIWKLTSA